MGGLGDDRTIAARYGPHRYSAREYASEHTDEFRGARFVDCELSGVKIADDRPRSAA